MFLCVFMLMFILIILIISSIVGSLALDHEGNPRSDTLRTRLNVMTDHLPAQDEMPPSSERELCGDRVGICHSLGCGWRPNLVDLLSIQCQY